MRARVCARFARTSAAPAPARKPTTAPGDGEDHHAASGLNPTATAIGTATLIRGRSAMSSAYTPMTPTAMTNHQRAANPSDTGRAISGHVCGWKIAVQDVVPTPSEVTAKFVSVRPSQVCGGESLSALPTCAGEARRNSSERTARGVPATRSGSCVGALESWASELPLSSNAVSTPAAAARTSGSASTATRRRQEPGVARSPRVRASGPAAASVTSCPDVLVRLTRLGPSLRRRRLRAEV